MFDRQETISSSRFKILASLSEEEKSQLRERIGQWRGLIRVFVHPFYYLPQEIPEGRAGFQRMEEMQRGLKRLLAFSPKKVPPIIIFQEDENLDDLDFTGCRIENSYIVPTWESSSTPLLEKPSGTIKNKGAGMGRLN